MVGDSPYAADQGIQWCRVSAVPSACGLLQQGHQCGHCCDMRVRIRLDSNRTAGHTVKHPHREFEASIGHMTLAATPPGVARRPLPHLMNVDNASGPRMKKI